MGGSFDFGKSAKELSRNPLGIIALFIVLVYGIAGLVFSTACGEIETVHRTMLVGFMIGFPCLVLLAFYRLVASHHTKLYAPGDFESDAGFLRAQTPGEKKLKLIEEVRELTAGTDGGIEAEDGANSAAGAAVTASSVGQAIIAGEEFAIREIEQEYGVQVQRQVSIESDVRVDGVFRANGKLRVIEVKVVRKQSFKRSIDSAISHLRLIAEREWAAGFILAIVVSDAGAAELDSLAEEATHLLQALAFRVDLRVYSLPSMNSQFGLE